MEKSYLPPVPVPEPGGEIELEISSMAFGGQGICKVDGFVVFVDKGLPGQKVLARITMLQKRHANAEIIEILSAAPEQIMPFCVHAGECGGCAWQHLDYPAQLKWKRKLLQNTLEHMAGLPGQRTPPVIASPHTLYFRNKMEFTFSGLSGFELELGLHRRSSNLVIPIRQCLLQSGPIIEILQSVREWCRASGLAAYNPESGAGFWRYLVTRTSQNQDLLLNFITYPRSEFYPVVQSLAAHLMELFPEISGFVHTTRRHKGPVAHGEKTQWSAGKDYLEEHLGELSFQIGAGSFFQTNTLAAATLYQEALRLAAPDPGSLTVDLYCGSGGLGIWLAAHGGVKVLGADISKESVASARKNAEINHLRQCRFYVSDAARFLRGRKNVPDLLLLNPPRGGISPQVAQAVLAIKPPKILYISCNPPTQARNYALLSDCYRVSAVQAVDMFPHNPHVENIMLLERL